MDAAPPLTPAVVPTPARVEERRTQYLSVVEESDLFPWTPDGFGGTTFALRVVPDSVQKELAKKCRFREYDRETHQPQMLTDWAKLNEELLKYAIQGWAGLWAAAIPERRIGEVLIPAKPAREIAFTPDAIRHLPERIKREINKICVGKEAGDSLSSAERREQQEQEKNG